MTHSDVPAAEGTTGHDAHAANSAVQDLVQELRLLREALGKQDLIRAPANTPHGPAASEENRQEKSHPLPRGVPRHRAAGLSKRLQRSSRGERPAATETAHVPKQPAQETEARQETISRPFTAPETSQEDHRIPRAEVCNVGTSMDDIAGLLQPPDSAREVHYHYHLGNGNSPQVTPALLPRRIQHGAT